MLPQKYIFKVNLSKYVFSKLPSEEIHFVNCFLKSAFLKDTLSKIAPSKYIFKFNFSKKCIFKMALKIALLKKAFSKNTFSKNTF